MLESMTIFNKGGFVLYQYTAKPSVMDKENDGGQVYTQQALQQHLFPLLLDPAKRTQIVNKSFHIADGITFCWTQQKVEASVKSKDSLVIVAVYPDILFEGPRQYLQQWAQGLVQKTAVEYCQYYEAAAATGDESGGTKENDNDTASTVYGHGFLQAPDPEPFDKVFRILLEQSKSQRPQQQEQQQQPSNQQPQQTSTSTAAAAKSDSSNKGKGSKKGKEKRQWHDGKAKVTKEAMADLDMSKKETEEDKARAQERALQEARAAYLPTDQDLQKQPMDDTAEADSIEQEQQQQSTLSNFFAHLTGNKVITDADLDAPLQQMEHLLTSKNVAAEIAQQLCADVRQKLRQKKLTQLYRVQTAVRQALEASLSHLLHRNPVDLLQNVVHKRRGSSDFSIFGSNKQAPYVIVVVGINGVGKSTSLAKLTYHLKQNGCSPLLVAGDTFRSGAVEQLSVHAQCLEVPIFSQGYAKDPSVVAKLAIQQATQDQNDVVLIDTAGRMQNNAPLMKALGKLVQENNPDFILFVCEALVGHDGLDQFKMFQQALGYKRKLNGLLLTKFDTVSDKVGAALTLTHETGAPIVFCGTGQKYHHLQKLEPASVIKALFS